MDEEQVIKVTNHWVKDFVIDLNLCPFAGQVFNEKTIHYKVCLEKESQTLLEILIMEIEYLRQNDSIATGFLIHPNVLNDFSAYNQFFDNIDFVMKGLGFNGEFQIASFHPEYQFTDTLVDAVENFTNRSPYPMLHILRESLVSKAIDSYPNVEAIPQRNIQRMKKIGIKELESRLSQFKP